MTQKPAQRRGLGRGLGSLIPTAPQRQDEAAPNAGSPADGAGNGAGNGAGEPPNQGGGRSADWIGNLPAPTDGQPGSTGDGASTTATPNGPALQPVEGAYFAELPVGSIRPNPRQPRQVFDEEAMAELVHSVKEIGLLQPVVVRPIGADEQAGAEGGAADGAADRTGDGAGPQYELIMGERRWRATQEAGLATIPAIVRETSDDDLLRDALLENLHRAQLNPLEEAAAYQQLLDDFGCTHEELAGRIGRSRPQISNTLRLLKLSPAVQRRVAAGVLSAGHARALLAVSDPEIQDRLAARVISEGISVRGLEEIVAVGDLGGGTRPAPRRNRPTAPGLADLASRLSDRLETRVKVDLGKSKGKITVEFASLPDLERIIAIMDPQNGGTRS